MLHYGALGAQSTTHLSLATSVAHQLCLGGWKGSVRLYELYGLYMTIKVAKSATTAIDAFANQGLAASGNKPQN